MDDDKRPTQETGQEDAGRAPKRSMRDRLLHKGAQRKPSSDHVAEDEPGADAESDQRAIEDEFWNKK
jgi:hypothetical protein